VRSSWSTARRDVGIGSGVVCEPPVPGARRVARLPLAVAALLDALGKPGNERQQLILDEAETAARRARDEVLAPRIAALSEAVERGWSAFAFPYDLTDDHRHEEHDMDIRADLAWALRPAGWSQASKGFRKKTVAGHELTLAYDRGPLGNITVASLALRGADWCHGLTIWPRRTSAQLRIRSRRTAGLFAANVAAAVAHVAKVWATPIEELYGPSTGWLPRP
jgi:hypothetical protein